MVNIFNYKMNGLFPNFRDTWAFRPKSATKAGYICSHPMKHEHQRVGGHFGLGSSAQAAKEMGESAWSDGLGREAMLAL
jgi:hypothetical protein